ncbi:MAG: hypothetical protein FWE66_00015 [Oscillospiraceae bacterium]|nr:hypothetical protein [Oscillospiraceae bacterium]
MKKLIRRTCDILRSKGGETIMESVVSMLVFSVLLVAVSAMVHTALTMILGSVRSAGIMQEQTINPVILSEYTETGASTTLTFTCDGFSAWHEVIMSDSDVLAFIPNES